MGRTKEYRIWKAALVCADCLFGDGNMLFALLCFCISNKAVFCFERYRLHRCLLLDYQKIFFYETKAMHLNNDKWVLCPVCGISVIKELDAQIQSCENGKHHRHERDDRLFRQ